jgi:hypothetical protein
VRRVRIRSLTHLMPGSGVGKKKEERKEEKKERR